MSDNNNSTCANCGKRFRMGWTGVSPNGIDLCDTCGIGYERSDIAWQWKMKGCLRTLIVIGLVVIAVMGVLILSKWGIL